MVSQSMKNLAIAKRKLPPGPRIPHQPNPTFVGREETLEHLWKNLKPEDSTVVALVGIGGSGKTQIAVEYCYRYCHLYDQIHWFQVEQGSSNKIVRCASPEICTVETNLSEQVSALLTSWNKRHLVVIDNVSSGEKGVAMLEKWLPKLSRTNLLITTRREDWPDELKINSIRVGMFTTNKSRVLFEKLAPQTKRSPKDQVSMLLERLGNLPLAIDLAGRYLASKTEMGAGDYLQELNECECILQHQSLTGWSESSPTRHTTNVANTYLISWFEVKDSIPSKMYRCLGYFAPDVPIPYSLLEQLLGVDEETLWEAVTRLTQKGLLYREDTGVVMPEMLMNFSWSLDLQLAESVLPHLVQQLGEIYKDILNKNDFTDQLRWNTLCRHLQRVVSVAYSTSYSDIEIDYAGRLVYLLGVMHYRNIDFEISRDYFLQAVAVFEEVYGQNIIIEPLQSLGVVLIKLSEFDSAKEIYETLTELLTAEYGPYHEKLLGPLTKLAKVYDELNEVEHLIETRKRILEVKVATYGPNDPKLLATLKHLGGDLAKRKDLEGLKQVYKKYFLVNLEYKKHREKLDISDEKIGEKLLLRTCKSMDFNKLVKGLNSLGGIESIKEVHKQIYDTFLVVHGPKDPRLPIMLFRFGKCFSDRISSYTCGLSDHEAGKQAYNKALKLIDDDFPGHPIEFRVLEGLTYVYKELGESDNVKALYERRISLQESKFGASHPTVFKEFYFLGRTMESLKEMDNAKESYEKAISLFEKTNNWISIMPRVYWYHGRLLVKRGELEEASSSFDKCLEQCSFEQEERRSTSFESLSWLAESYYKLGDIDVVYKITQKIISNLKYPEARCARSIGGNLLPILVELEDWSIIKYLLKRIINLKTENIRMLGWEFKKMEQSQNMIKLYELSVTLYEQSELPDSVDMGYFLRSFSDQLIKQHKYKEAKTALQKALRNFISGYGTQEHFNVTKCMNNLGTVLHDLHELKKARSIYKRALEIDKKLLGSQHRMIPFLQQRAYAIDLQNYAFVLLDLGEYDEAYKNCKRAVNIFASIYSSDHSSLKDARRLLKRIEKRR